MNSSNGNQKTIKRIAVGGIGLMLIVGGLRVIGTENIKYFSQLTALEQRRSKIESLGVSLSGKERTFSTEEYLLPFNESPFRQASVGRNETSEIAISLLADKSVLRQLSDTSAMPDVLDMPSPSDFLYKQSSIASKRAAKSVKVFVSDAISRGASEDALQGAELLFAMQDALIPTASEETIVFWFGLNGDLLQLVWNISQMPAITPAQMERLVRMVGPDIRVYSLKKLAARQCQEMIAMTRGVAGLNKELMEILYTSTEANEVPKTIGKKVVRDTMESELLQVWINIFQEYSADNNPEIVGAYMDQISLTSIAAVRNTESEYMVLAMPYLFEQFGRMTMRVIQARAALLLALTGKLSVGEAKLKMSGFEVLLNINDENGHWVVTTPNSALDGRYNVGSGLEINQIKGVRLFVKKN